MTRDTVVQPLVAEDRFVAFLDILGWASRVVCDIESTIALYDTIIGHFGWVSDPHPDASSIRVFSDSVVVVGKQLGPVLQIVNGLQFLALANDCLLRGGVAFGKHAERAQGAQFHVVSVPLVLAARLEETIGVPGVAVHETAMPVFDYAEYHRAWVFQRALLFFRGLWVVNPFNMAWGTSAAFRVERLREQHPEHSAKYDWFLDLYQAVRSGAPLVPV